MNSVIITGAGGFIGSALTARLLSQGITVYGVDISAEKLDRFAEYDNFKPIIADFSMYNKLDELISERGFDVFYHFAWQGVYGEAFKDYEMQLNNVRYACDALMQSKKLEYKKFVFAGSMNEYEVKTYLNEDYYKPRYTCIYGACKLSAEMILKTLAFNNDIEYCGGLIAMAYGENNYSKMLPNVVINQLNRGISPKLIEGNNLYDLIYIDDIAAAFEAIGRSGKNMKSYYVGHRNIVTFKELITLIRDIIDPDVELQFGAFPVTTTFDYSLIDLDALYNDTGFECKADFKESILKTAEWVKTLDI